MADFGEGLEEIGCFQAFEKGLKREKQMCNNDH
jgi:hypothetical protein